MPTFLNGLLYDGKQFWWFFFRWVPFYAPNKIVKGAYRLSLVRSYIHTSRFGLILRLGHYELDHSDLHFTHERLLKLFLNINFFLIFGQISMIFFSLDSSFLFQIVHRDMHVSNTNNVSILAFSVQGSTCCARGSNFIIKFISKVTTSNISDKFEIWVLRYNTHSLRTRQCLVCSSYIKNYFADIFRCLEDEHTVVRI